MKSPQLPSRIESTRPLVRYVDAEQAVVEVVVNLQSPLPRTPVSHRQPPARDVALWLDVDGDDGFHDEEFVHLTPRADTGSVKVRIVQPRRWWPAGMGEQPLYDLKLGLVVDDELSDEWAGTVGLTSVRRERFSGEPVLVVNGKECKVGAVLPVDEVHEKHLLPVTGDSIMIVRGHWGTDVLFEAADRAGVLLIQAIPVDADGRPEATVVDQVNRLSRHPSLAGWYVGHLGHYTERMSYLIQSLDPTHAIWRQLPNTSPAAA